MKKILSLCLVVVFVFALVACGDSSADTSTETETGSSSGGLIEGPEPNQFMACDQETGRIIVYDLDRIEPGEELDNAIVWTYNGGYAAGLKYREDTVFGDVILIAGTTSAIVSFPEGKVIWSTRNPGNNPHSIEMLPSGNIVIANSTGNCLRMFNTSALLSGKTIQETQDYEDTVLEGAHGVLWDPKYNVLWALGNTWLIACERVGEGETESISRIQGKGSRLPSQWGHDLAPDYTNTRYLYLTVGDSVLRYDKDTKTFEKDFPNADKISHDNVKGVGNNLNGHFFVIYPNGGPGTSWEKDGKAEWCSDTIYYCYMRTDVLMYKQAYKSSTGAFYKIRTFCGQYQ